MENMLRTWDDDWDDCGAVASREASGEILVVPPGPRGPGAERGLASRSRYDAVGLEFEVRCSPAACFLAKIHQADRIDQTTDSYHLFWDRNRAYLARHHHVFRHLLLPRDTWQRIRLCCAGGVLALYLNDRLVHRVRDGALAGGYAFLGAQGGAVRLRAVRLSPGDGEIAAVRRDRAEPPSARQAGVAALRYPQPEGGQIPPGISYCIVAFRPTYARLLVEDLIRKTSVPYEILVWLNVADGGFEEFLADLAGRGAPLRILGRSPENIGMRALRSLFAAARYPLVTQIDDDVLCVSPGIAERARRIFEHFPRVRQVVADVWQDEFTTGARPPMSAYRAVSPEEGLYDGPIDGWFAIYHRSALPLLLSLPYGQYSTIGSTMRGQLSRHGLFGLLCTRMRVFHAIGPHYAAHFGMLPFEAEKYRRLQRHDIEAWYRSVQDALPHPAALERQVATIAHSLATPGPW